MRSKFARLAAASLLASAAYIPLASHAFAQEGQPGGVLRILGTADVDHFDPTSAALVTSNNFLRAVTRQLISYAASTDENVRITPEGDLATEVPQPTNDGLT